MKSASHSKMTNVKWKSIEGPKESTKCLFAFSTWTWIAFLRGVFIPADGEADLFVGTIVVSFLLIDCLRHRFLKQKPVKGDAGIVGTEDFDAEPIHELLQGVVEVSGI